jgi:hypothetical protein
MKDKNLLIGHIAGFSYYDGVEVFKMLEIGTRLRLVPEPENPFDPFAVAVYFRETKLGYIPRQQNRTVHQFLELGYRDLFDVIINRVTPEANPEGQIGIVVRIREAG